MAKAGELDWSELKKSDDKYRHTPTALWSAVPGAGVDPLNKAEKILKDGETPYKPTNEEIAKAILHGANRPGVGQWKDEDELHKEVVSQAQAEKMQKNWENTFQSFYEAGKAPINEEEQDCDWGTGKSFNSTLSEQERLKRNMYTGE